MNEIAQSLRRRPPGPKRLIYFDQSTFSFMNRPEGRRLLEVVRMRIAADEIRCPTSPDHDDETVLVDPDAHDGLARLIEQLSTGIRFAPDRDIVRNEILNAASTFCGRPSRDEPWREAFRVDPHTPHEKLFPGGFRIFTAPMRPDWHVAEVSREKAGADGLSLVYERMRGSGKSFTEHTEREYNGAIRGRLGPLIDPAGASAHYRSLFENAQREFMTGEFPNDDRIFGPEVSRFQNFGTTLQFCELILNDNPELMDPKRRIGFLRSTELRRCPALMYPSLIYSGLALTRGRKARPSDRYDRTHLTKGLSRCDVVTTDPGMAQMLRERGLVPKDVKLFSSREHDSLLHYFEGLAQENRND